MIRPDSYPNSLGPDASHQFGSYKDETAVGANDGTGLFKDQMMDAIQWIFNLMTKFSDTPSGSKEDATTSEALEALEKDIKLFAGNVDTINSSTTYTVAADNKNGILRALAGVSGGTITLGAGAGIDDGSRLTIINESGGTVTINPGGITLLDDERILLWYNSHTTAFDSLLGDNVIIGTINNVNATQSTSSTTGSYKLAGGMGIAKNLYVGQLLRCEDTTDATTKDSGSIVTEGGFGVEKNIHAGGAIKSDDTTDSTSGITGSIQTDGGVGAAKAGVFEGGTKRGSTAGGAKTLKEKIIEIGDWNMDSTISISVNHGLTQGKIRSVSGIIRDDTDSSYNTLPYAELGAGGSGVPELSIGNISATAIALSRRTGGPFDATSHDATSYNRGWLYIIYEI